MSDEKAPRLRKGLLHVSTGTEFGWPDAITFWGWYDVITAQGIDRALQMAMEPALLVARDHADEQRADLRLWLETIKYWGDRTNREEEALDISYRMLQLKNWSRPQAARFAEDLLGRPISPEAWRKAVNKWARENNRPKLDLPHGRPTSKKRNYE